MKFSLKTALFGGAAALAMIAATPSLAQDADGEEEASQPSETIVVTGSRIARDSNVTAPVPVQSVSGEDIALSGEFNVTDVIKDVPALVASTNSEFSSEINSPFSPGTNALELRNLGTARTLTLIDGRRSVPGIEGTAAVDISSIPPGLIESVEVLTGGASAIYGADAVTGVINFILKDDFEGFDLNLTTGIGTQWDGEQYSLNALAGKNFDEGRGNFTFAISAGKDNGLLGGDRLDRVPLGGPASAGGEWANPALRFQQGDIGTSTPNFERYFNFANTGLYNYGLRIPSEADFIADYTAEFGTAPTLTAEERALLDRALNALPRTVIDQPVFSITAGRGQIGPGNPLTFAGFNAVNGIDTDNNGVDDCLDSFLGYNSTFERGAFGVAGGCWTVNPDGSIRPVRDNIITGNFNGGGGDAVFDDSGNFLLPQERRIAANMTADYEFKPWATGFVEANVSYSHTETDSVGTSFWDYLYGAADNPFIPAPLQGLATATGGLGITIDPTIFGRDRNTDERRVFRLASGFEGVFNDDWNYEVVASWGEFRRKGVDRNVPLNDRFFAAIDAVIDPATGQPTCRVNVDPTALPETTPFGIPVFDQGIFSFARGDCVPLNIWAAESGVTDEAKAWVLHDEVNKDMIHQYVLSGFFAGDSSEWFNLPGGPVGFAAGAEYRKETSKAEFDPLQLGILPADSPNAGQLISDFSSNVNILFRPNLGFVNSTAADAQFDVSEAFAEVSLPILSGVTLAEELTIDLAGRISEYSTVGQTTTWKVGGSWAPVNDLRFRATLSEAVRAPNIGELFSPDQGTTFRPADPCSIIQINNLNLVDPTLGAQRQANCTADLTSIGIDPTGGTGTYNFLDPLSASFGGLTGGNANLSEETAETITAGFVYQPSFFDGFTLTVDYWDVTIDDAIQSIASQDIVDGCYDGPALNQNFCSLFTRNPDPTSAQAGGLNFLRVAPINFARFEAAGTDFAAGYDFGVGANDFGVRLQGTKTEKYNLFRDPTDPTLLDDELGEAQSPEWAVNLFLDFNRGPIGLGWQTQWLSEQTEFGVEIEEVDALFGPIGIAGDSFRHDLTWQYTATDQFRFFGGVNNVTDETPFRTSAAYPVSSRGRYFFIGANVSLQ